MNSGSRTGNATYSEILTQTEAWQEALEVVTEHGAELAVRWQEQEYAGVVFTGCGSTYYLSLAAAALFQELTELPAVGIPGGELMMNPGIAYRCNGPTLLVAISRSAETTETVTAVETFLDRNYGDVITVSTRDDRPLPEMGMFNLIIPSGQEQSIAQTRSFAAMYVATTALALVLSKNEKLLESMQSLPEHGQYLMATYEKLACEFGGDLTLDRIYYLGSGFRYGLACEANLKMKEMSLTHSEAFHFLEFRHGPKSMVCSSALVVGLLSQTNYSRETAVLEDVRFLGGKVLSLGNSGSDVPFASGLPGLTRNVLYLPVLQLMAYYRALAKDLDPDHPKNLDAVVRLE